MRLVSFRDAGMLFETVLPRGMTASDVDAKEEVM